MHYCGLDLGSRKTQVCILDEDDQVILQRSVPSDPESVLAAIRSKVSADDVQCVAESTFNWEWLIDGLCDADFDVCLAHTLGLRAISSAKVKTDKQDARTLARLLRGDLIPKAYITPRSRRGFRDLLRRRWSIVADRSEAYRSLRFMLYKQGRWDHSLSEIKGLSSADAACVSAEPSMQLAAQCCLERIELFSQQIDEIEAYLNKEIEQHFGADLKYLKTMPGVGDIIGLTILLETGEIARFADARKYSSYCRVVPGCANSSGVQRRGKNSKQGNQFLKWAYMHAAVKAAMHYPEWKALQQRYLKRHRGKGGNLVANNTLAHRLAQVAFHILRDQTPYQKELLFPPSAFS